MIYSEEGDDVYLTETVYDRATGLPRRQRTTLNGLRHAPPDGSPSEIRFDDLGRPYQLWWHEFDLEHNFSGPSSVLLHLGTKTHQAEVYCLEGRPRPKEFGPYMVRRDKEGRIWSEEFVDENQMPQPKAPKGFDI